MCGAFMDLLIEMWRGAGGRIAAMTEFDRCLGALWSAAHDWAEATGKEFGGPAAWSGVNLETANPAVVEGRVFICPVRQVARRRAGCAKTSHMDNSVSVKSQPG
jgi:hypothetical protein